MIKLYDTNALIDLYDKIFDEEFYVSRISLRELENIKNSKNKDEEIKYRARKLSKMFQEQSYMYHTVCTEFDNDPHLGNDDKIIKAVKFLQDEGIDVVFMTNDACCYNLAKAEGLKVRSTGAESDDESYLGFRELNLTEEELSEFYSCKDAYMCKIHPEILQNEYFFIKAKDEVVDVYRRVGNEAKRISYPVFNSEFFGDVKPKDIYQRIAMDSMMNNQITIVRGPAGSGKSWLCMSYLFSLLEKGKIDKVIIFCNTVAVKNAAKLGFYPGDKNEKLLDSQVGNFLSSKLGSRIMVEKMIQEEKLVLVPAADARGYDTTGMNAGVYIQEAQNLDRELMKLLLQRLGEDTICLIDGDDTAQVDLDAYAGMNNGIKRAVEVFKGQDFFGTVQLQKVRRSRIAEVADGL